MTFSRGVFTLTHKVLIPLAVLAALAVPALTHNAALAGWVGTPGGATQIREDLPHNIPVWTKADAKRFPGCQPLDPTITDYGLVDWVVVRVDATHERWSFGRMIEKDPRITVWTIGYCR